MNRGVFSRRMREIFAALISTAVLFTCFIPVGRAETLNFTVVNTSILPFAAKYRHITLSQGTLVSHFALTESGIGVSSVYTPAQRYFSLTCSGKTITFEIGSSVAFDSERQYDQRCNMVYDGDLTLFMLPVDFICEYFEWESNITPNTKYGDMLRITTRKNSMGDKNFLLLFEKSLEKAWLDVNPTPSPSPANPTASSRPSSPSPSPSASVPPSSAPIPISVYVTFEGGPNELTSEFLDILDYYGMPAAFFMRGSQMEDYPADMRRIAASTSFTVGLGGYDKEEFYDSQENVTDILNADNESLYACTLTKTMLVRVPAGSEGLTDEMRRELVLGGYRYWDWTVDATADAAAGKVYNTVAAKLGVLLSKADREPERCVLMLSQDRETLDALDAILSYLSDRRFTVQRLGESLSPINSRKDQCTLHSIAMER